MKSSINLTPAKRAEYLLYNPYHDERGRFASKSSAVSVVGGKPGDELKSPGYVKRERTAVEKKVFEPVAKFLSREGFKYSALRFGIDIGMDRALYALAGIHVTQAAAALGVAAGTALIGGTLAPAILGVGAGLAAAIIWYTISEKLTDRAFYGFVNKYNDSSKTARTIGMTSAGKWGRRAAWMDRLTLSPGDIGLFLGQLITGGGAKGILEGVGQSGTSSMIMTGNDMVTHAATAPDILSAIEAAIQNIPLFADPYDMVQPIDVRPATGFEDGMDHAKMMVMLPHVINVELGISDALIIPAIPQTSGLDKLGFEIGEFEDTRDRDGLYVLDKAGAGVFMKNYRSGVFPKLGSFIFDDEPLEEMIAPYAV